MTKSQLSAHDEGEEKMMKNKLSAHREQDPKVFHFSNSRYGRVPRCRIPDVIGGILAEIDIPSMKNLDDTELLRQIEFEDFLLESQVSPIRFRADYQLSPEEWAELPKCQRALCEFLRQEHKAKKTTFPPTSPPDFSLPCKNGVGAFLQVLDYEGGDNTVSPWMKAVLMKHRDSAQRSSSSSYVKKKKKRKTTATAMMVVKKELPENVEKKIMELGGSNVTEGLDRFGYQRPPKSFIDTAEENRHTISNAAREGKCVCQVSNSGASDRLWSP